MKEKLEVLSIGTNVKLTEDVFGTVLGISIKQNNTISYEVGWWNSSSYTQQVFQSHQITSDSPMEKVQQIGFA